MAIADAEQNLTGTLVDHGEWADGSVWEFWRTPDIPPAELCTAVACVAMYGFDPKKTIEEQRVILTQNDRGWEMIAGHIERVGRYKQRENIRTALGREILEEGGATIDPRKLVFFGYREICTPQRKRQPGSRIYPPLSFMPYAYINIDQPLGRPTGHEIKARRIFPIPEIRDMATRGVVQATELTLIVTGVEAALEGGSI